MTKYKVILRHALDLVSHSFIALNVYLYLFESDLRVEWLKSRARANRWKEEIQLVEEEMRRSLEFCKYLHSWWLQQASFRTANSSHLQEGLRAYASEMADKEDRRRMAWGLTWATIRERAKMVLEGYLNDREAEDSFPIPKLTLEIDVEDGQDLFDEISDTEY
jgi:hypothetical protein